MAWDARDGLFACIDEVRVDGGIGALNAREAVDAGASVLVAGSAVYAHAEGAAEGVRAIRKALGA